LLSFNFSSFYCKLVKVWMLCILCNNWCLFGLKIWSQVGSLASVYPGSVEFPRPNKIDLSYKMMETKRRSYWVYLYNTFNRFFKIHVYYNIVHPLWEDCSYLPKLNYGIMWSSSHFLQNPVLLAFNRNFLTNNFLCFRLFWLWIKQFNPLCYCCFTNVLLWNSLKNVLVCTTYNVQRKKLLLWSTY